MNSFDQHIEPEDKSVIRLSSDLTTVVRIRENDAEVWKQITTLTTVSHNAASFTLLREYPVGRLLTLVLKMPPEYRVYDKDEDLYVVMAIVESCYRSTIDGKEIFNFSVGFTGKHPPESFRIDPSQNYRIDGMQDNGMWRIVKVDKPFKSRRHPRVWRRLPVTLAVRQEDQVTLVKEFTSTQNIGISGVSIESDFDAGIGDTIQITCKQLDFSSLAIVRDRKAEPDRPATIHLEFIEAEFPLERLPDPKT